MDTQELKLGLMRMMDRGQLPEVEDLIKALEWAETRHTNNVELILNKMEDYNRSRVAGR